MTALAHARAIFATLATQAHVEAIITVTAIHTQCGAVITGVARWAEHTVAFAAVFPTFRANEGTFGTVITAAVAQIYIVSTLSAGFAVTACTIVTQFACRTEHGIIVYIAGIAILAGYAFLPVAFQAYIVTVVTAHVAAVKTAVAKLAAFLCGTFIAIRTMLIIIYGTLNVHMAVFAPVHVVTAVSAVLTVVFLEAVAASAFRAAVIAAAADPVISNKFSAKVAMCLRIPCICRRCKNSRKHEAAQQYTQQLIQFHFCFH